MENFSFTFTLPKIKLVYYKGKKYYYHQMAQPEQYDFLETHIQRVNSFKDGQIKWVYEEHEDGRLHIHGYIKNTTLEKVDAFRALFYKHPVIIARSQYEKLSNIQKTIVDIEYFILYMAKGVIYNMREIKPFLKIENSNNIISF